MKQYDLIVIGGGPGGVAAASMGAAKGLDVALVEARELGGTCLNRGCIPTKCLCATAGLLLDIAGSAPFGISVEGVSADYGKAHARAAEIVAGLRADLASSLSDVDVIEGTAVLGEGRTVLAGGQFLRARHIIIATGSRPAPFPAGGAEYVLDSDAFLKLEELPRSLAIVGGGVIGLEFASIAAAFGCEVTVFEFCKEILPGFDSEIAKRLRSYLSRRGIKILTGAKVTAVSECETGRTVLYEQKGKVSSMEAAAVVCAVGRRPVLPEGLESAGVRLDERGFIAVDNRFTTDAEGIYAIGDVNGKLMLAHVAEAQARIVTGTSEAIGCIPAVVFTEPECATVGINVDSADGLAAVKVPYSANSKALASGAADGLVKLVYNQANRHVVGCQIVGAHAADLIGEAALMIDAGYTVERFADFTVSAHPGLSELLQTAAARAS